MVHHGTQLTARSGAERPERTRKKIPITTLRSLRKAEAECTRCPLYKNATQVVPGEGQETARLMVVGEQPGDREDLAGKPFVGPAGRILDQALANIGLDRNDIFVSNAVKHFKHEMRGKRRIHKRPNAYEIERCKWWLDQELALVRPKVVVALGVTAAQSLLGRKVTIAAMRGHPHPLGSGTTMFVTIHPSALLRIEDEAEKRSKYMTFVSDLRLAHDFV